MFQFLNDQITRRILFVAGCLMCLVLMSPLVTPPAFAQTGPTKSEAQKYKGLHAAAWKGDVAEILRLGKAGANPNARDAAGRTPLHVAAFASQDEALPALVKIGGDPNLLEKDKYDIVTIASVANDVALLKVALRVGGKPGNTTSIYDGTALIAAAHLGHVGVVKTLIKAGAPLDHVNNLGWTALIESIVLGDGGKRHTETLRALLDAGASTRIPDRAGRLPVQLARARGYKMMVALIQKADKKRSKK